MFPDNTAINNRNALKAKRYDEMIEELAALRAENARLREALTFLVQWVADNNFEGEFDVDLVLEDAREALKGES